MLRLLGFVSYETRSRKANRGKGEQQIVLELEHCKGGRGGGRGHETKKKDRRRRGSKLYFGVWVRSL
eukprot:702368-Hanusia_phi.AAC.2